MEYVRAKQRELQEEHGQDCRVLCIHGHYADAAEARAAHAHACAFLPARLRDARSSHALRVQIACMTSSTLGTPVFVTGHSLGRNKLDNILKGALCALAVRTTPV